MKITGDIGNLGFGGDSITSVKTYSSAIEILEFSFDLGIRHFDTAPLYGKGYSEKIFGKFLKNKRSQVSLTTKFGLPSGFRYKNIPLKMLLPLNYYFKIIKGNRSGKSDEVHHQHVPIPFRIIDDNDIKLSFFNSLKQLQTEYIDYYLLHEGLPTFLTESAIIYLNNLKQQGKILKIGIGSNIKEIEDMYPITNNLWDVLQYEGYNDDEVRKVRSKFPDQIHFHHGCFKGVKLDYSNGIEPKLQFGHLLAKKAINNIEGKIIFSSTNQNNIRNNIEGFLNYNANYDK